ncbi:MAG: hypothetical protein AB7U73_15255 [Pirellulales bacterium]
MKRWMAISMLLAAVLAASFATPASARPFRSRYRSYSFSGSRANKQPLSLNTHYNYGYRGVGRR